MLFMRRILFSFYRWSKRLIRQPLFPVICLATVTAVVGLLLQWGNGFPDPDVYYHAALAWRLAHGEVVRQFIWLPLTILATSFADHHFLLHLFQAPFVGLAGLSGMKFAATLLAVFFVVCYYKMLRRYNVPGAVWWTLLVLFSAPFLFRLNLVKALPLSLIIYFFGLSSLVERRYYRLFFISVAYVWAYGGWPLLWVTSIMMALFILITEKKFSPEVVRGFFATSFGSFVGLTVNPWFPENIIFYWYQIVKIALSPGGQIGAGQEWRAYAPAELFVQSLPLVISFFVTLLVGFFSVADRPQVLKGSIVGAPGRLRFLSTIMAVLFFLATLLSRRYIEYLIPVGFLAVCMWVAYLAELGVWKAMAQSFLEKFHKEKVAVSSLLILLILMSGGYFVFTNYRVYTLFRNSTPPQTLEQVALHLSAIAEPGEIILNVRWDEFPQLFYFNPHFGYLWGLDTRFLPATPEMLVVRKDLVDGDAGSMKRFMERIDSTVIVVSAKDRSMKLLSGLRQVGYILRYTDNGGSIYTLPHE